MSRSNKEHECELDTHTFAIRFGDGKIEIGSSDTQEFIAVLDGLKELGIEVKFDGVIYGLPWCG